MIADSDSEARNEPVQNEQRQEILPAKVKKCDDCQSVKAGHDCKILPVNTPEFERGFFDNVLQSVPLILKLKIYMSAI